MEGPARNILRIMLGELLDHMRGAQDVASGIAKSTLSTKRWPKRCARRPTWWPWRANLKPTANAKATTNGGLCQGRRLLLSL